MNAATEKAIARVRLLERHADRVIVGIANTQYRVHLAVDQPIDVPVGKRLRGLIRCGVWKVDQVNEGGGSFVEPIYGRPHRVQGPVIGRLPELNAVIVEVYDCPFVGLLPERYDAAQYPDGDRIGLDVYEGARFEPVA